MLLKLALQSTIKSMAKNAPWGVRQAILQGVAEREGPSRILSQFARQAQITAFMAEGRHGLIQASSADETLIQAYARTKTWADATVAHIKAALPAGGTYLDIGANIGLTTIPIAQDHTVRCIAFEPDPVNFRHLTANIARNCHHDNVRLMQAAVMERPGSLSFGLSDEGNPGDHRIIKGETTRQVITVAGITLDGAVDKVSGPLVVKIDTQGAEPYVIAGGQRVLSQARAAVMEFWPFGMEQMGGHPDHVYEFVRQFDVVELATGEREEKRTLKSAIDELRHLFDRGRNDLYQYWDLYLAR